jgi:hypothetical protein
MRKARPTPRAPARMQQADGQSLTSLSRAHQMTGVVMGARKMQ